MVISARPSCTATGADRKFTKPRIASAATAASAAIHQRRLPSTLPRTRRIAAQLGGNPQRVQISFQL